MGRNLHWSLVSASKDFRRSQILKNGYGPDCGPSRGDACRHSIRPSATVPDAAPRVRHCQAHGGPEGGLWRGDWPEGGPRIWSVPASMFALAGP